MRFDLEKHVYKHLSGKSFILQNVYIRNGKYLFEISYKLRGEEYPNSIQIAPDFIESYSTDRKISKSHKDLTDKLINSGKYLVTLMQGETGGSESSSEILSKNVKPCFTISGDESIWIAKPDTYSNLLLSTKTVDSLLKNGKQSAPINSGRVRIAREYKLLSFDDFSNGRY